MLFQSCLVKIRALVRLGGVLCRHFLERYVNKMAAAGCFSSRYRALFAGIVSTRRCGAPTLEGILYARLLAPRIQ